MISLFQQSCSSAYMTVAKVHLRTLRRLVSLTSGMSCYTSEYISHISNYFSTHAYGTLQDSRWVVGTLDVIPVEIALPQNISKRAVDYLEDWQV